MADTTGASWSDIPLDVAGRILHRLPAHVERVRFGAVCPQWRAATRHGPPPPPLPLLLLSDGRVYSLPESKQFDFNLPGSDSFHFSLLGSEPFHLTGSTGYTDACGDWLVLSNEEGCFLRDPFSNATVTLPPLSRVRTRLAGCGGGPVWSQAPHDAFTIMKRHRKRKRTFIHHVRGGVQEGVSNDEDVLSLGPSWILKPPMHVGDESVNVATLEWITMAQMLRLEEEPETCKLWLCSPNFIVATVYFTGGQRIAVCQPGATSWWSVCLENDCPDFVDIAFHQGKIYALDAHDSLFAIDVSMDNSSSDPWISQMRKIIDSPYLHMPLGCPRWAYLVESRGVLLLVLRKLCLPMTDPGALIKVNATELTELDVFEADFSQSRWFKVTTIGNNQVLFLRRRCNRSVCVSHNASPGDCIFFLDNDNKDCPWYGASSSCSVYSMTDGKVSSPLPTVAWKPGIVFGTWLFPQN